MICPKCKAEYRDGFTRCSDCDIELVDKLSEEKDVIVGVDYIEYELVMSTFNTMDITIVKSILEDNNIIYHINADSSFHQAGPSRVLVKKDQAEAAKEILKDVIFS